VCVGRDATQRESNSFAAVGSRHGTSCGSRRALIFFEVIASFGRVHRGKGGFTLRAQRVGVKTHVQGSRVCLGRLRLPSDGVNLRIHAVLLHRRRASRTVTLPSTSNVPDNIAFRARLREHSAVQRVYDLFNDETE